MRINKRLYFMHIPKVGGISIMSQVKIVLNQLGLPSYPPSPPPHDDNFNDYLYIQGHLANYPLDKTENLDVACIIRDPLDRAISNFLFMYQNNNFFVNKYLNINNFLDKLKYYLFKDKDYFYHNNIQSKFICYSPDKNYFNKIEDDVDYLQKRSKGWFLPDMTPSLDETIEKINSFNIVGTTKNHDVFCNKISDWFNINYNFSISFNNNIIINQSSIIYDNENYDTIKLRNMLSKEEIILFLNNNLIDFELYDYILNNIER